MMVKKSLSIQVLMGLMPVFAVTLVFLAQTCVAQVNVPGHRIRVGYHYQVALNDGSRVTGLVLGCDSNYLSLLRNGDYTLEIPIRNIQRVTRVEITSFRGDTMVVSPFSDAYFRESAAFIQRFLVPQVRLSILGDLSVSAGFKQLIMLTLTTGVQTTGIKAKIACPVVKEKLNIGFESSHGKRSRFIEHDEILETFFTGLASFGKDNRNITIGFGYRMVNGAVDKLPYYFLAGSCRESSRLALIGEIRSYPQPWDVLNEYPRKALYTVGVRYFTPIWSLGLGFSSLVYEKDWFYSMFPFVDFRLQF